MKQLLSLSVLAILLVGCVDDNAANPWSTAEERAAKKAEKSAEKHQAEAAKAADAKAADPKGTDAKPSDAPVAKPVFSFIQKKDDAPKVEEVKPIEAAHAMIVAVRSDAGLIQFKRPEPTNPGDKLVLTKDGASLLVVATIVEGDSVIADIAPKQVKVPAILVGDVISCTVPVDEKAPAAPAPAAAAPAAEASK